MSVELLPLAISGGWASGISAYAVVFLSGLLARLDVWEGPAALARTDVLVLFGLLTAVEFVADKVAYLDSAWDSVHTVIRPAIAAVLGLLLTGEASTLEQAVVASGMGLTALLTHLSKAGIRLAVNSSPEPVTNVGVSLAEETALVGVVALAVQEPWLAAGVALTLLVVMLVLAAWLAGRVRRGWRRMAVRLEAWQRGDPPPPRRW